MITYDQLKRNTLKSYLGFCEQMGFIYSLPITAGKYAVVALNNSRVTVLITYTAPLAVEHLQQ